MNIYLVIVGACRNMTKLLPRPAYVKMAQWIIQTPLGCRMSYRWNLEPGTWNLDPDLDLDLRLGLGLGLGRSYYSEFRS